MDYQTATASQKSPLIVVRQTAASEIDSAFEAVQVASKAIHSLGNRLIGPVLTGDAGGEVCRAPDGILGSIENIAGEIRRHARDIEAEIDRINARL